MKENSESESSGTCDFSTFVECVNSWLKNLEKEFVVETHIVVDQEGEEGQLSYKVDSFKMDWKREKTAFIHFFSDTTSVRSLVHTKAQ